LAPGPEEDLWDIAFICEEDRRIGGRYWVSTKVHICPAPKKHGDTKCMVPACPCILDRYPIWQGMTIDHCRKGRQQRYKTMERRQALCSGALGIATDAKKSDQSSEDKTSGTTTLKESTRQTTPVSDIRDRSAVTPNGMLNHEEMVREARAGKVAVRGAVSSMDHVQT